MSEPAFVQPSTAGFVLPQFAGKVLWCVVGGFIIFLTIINFASKGVAKLRKRALQNGYSSSAHFFDPFDKCWSVLQTALGYTLPPFSVGSYELIRFPRLGDIIVVASYIVVVFILIYVKIDPNYNGDTAQRAYRAAYLTAYQTPLVVALSARQVLLPFMTGISSERLNVFHRWIARTMLITSSIHFTYVKRGLGLTLTEIFTTHKYRFGLAAWIFLLWIVASSFAPVRGFGHEFFIIQHVISFCGFFVMIAIHTPGNARIVVLPAIGILLFNRVFNVIRTLIVNKYRVLGSTAYQATLTASPSSQNVLIEIPTPISWKPAQHVYVTFPSINRLESHPFTIFTLPTDGKISLNARVKNGMTKKLLDRSYGTESLPVIISPPMGEVKDYSQYQDTLFFSGGTGTSYNIPLAVDFARHARSEMSPDPRMLQFIVVTRQLEDLIPYGPQLVDIMSSASEGKLAAKVVIYITSSAPRRNSNQDDSSEKGIVTNTTRVDNARLDFAKGAEVHSGRPDLTELFRSSVASTSRITGVSICASSTVGTAASNALASLALEFKTRGAIVHNEVFNL